MTAARKSFTRRVAVNGVELAVWERGKGVPVLLVHGYPMNHHIWDSVLDELAEVRAIVLDLRGFGESAVPEVGYSMASYAEDLKQLLEALELRRAYVVGLSMGGYIAFELFRRYPDLVAGLGLVATRASADSSAARQARENAIRLVRERGASAIADAMLPRLFAPGFLEERPGVAAGVRTMIEATPVPGIAGALAAMRDRRDQSDLLAALGRVPVLVVAGERDQLIELDEITRLHDRIPGAELLVIPGSGHLVPVEGPAALGRALEAWLRSTG